MRRVRHGTIVALSLTLAAALGGPRLAARQQPPPASAAGQDATALILGRVLDGSTDRPMAGVIVTLRQLSVTSAPVAPPTQPGAGPPPARVITGENGQFLFSSLPAGRYDFTLENGGGAMIGGYGMRRPDGSTQTLDVAAGQRIGDVVLRTWKPASVSGTLLDQYGDPVVATRVGVLSVDVVAGHRRYRPGPTAITDDRGMFRISGIAPGEYTAYVPFAEITIPDDARAASAAAADQSARSQLQRQLAISGAPSLNGSGFHVGDAVLVRSSNTYGADGPIDPTFVSPAPDADGRLRVYPFTYAPGTTSLAEATTFVLESGQERSGTDIQVRLTPAFRVGGRVLGPDGPAALTAVRLVPQGAIDAADETAFEAAKTVTTSAGEFTFLGVPQGQYTLKVARVPTNQRPPSFTSVNVGSTTMFSMAPDANLPPLPIPDAPTLSATQTVAVVDADVTDLTVSLRAGGRISGHVAYDGSSPPLTADQLVRATISLDPIDGRSFTGATGKGQFDASGAFTTIGLLPGKYLLRVGGNLGPWTLGSAMANGRDIADTPIAMDTSDVNGVVITLTDRASNLAGVVRDRSGAADANAVVLVFPTTPAAWVDGGANPRRIKSARASATGAYRIDPLPPGDYCVIAIDDRFSGNWQDPQRLDALARTAEHITIAPGESKRHDVTTETVR